MKLPTINKWSAGDQPDAAMFNEISYALDFAMDPPTAWVVRTGTAQPIAANTFVGLNLTTVVIDTGASAGDSPIWTSDNPSKLFVQTPGWYDIEANIEWPSATDTANRRILGIRHYDATGAAILRSRIDTLPRGAMKQRCYITWFLNIGDAIEVVGYSSVATTFGIDGGTNSTRDGIRLRWFSM